MAEIMIFGGTSEGRRLAEYCIGNGIETVFSVVSEYGGSLLPESPLLKVQEKALPEGGMKAWMEQIQPRLVVDATHPYAACVSQYISKNCELLGIRRLRVVREESAAGRDGIVSVRSAEEAADYLFGREGNVLVTTGSKELEAFTKLPGYEERLFARVLPSVEVLKKCSDLSIRGKHVIAMQGPFSREMNAAMMRQLEIRFLVTKEAGTAGGFEEKITAAKELGVQAVVIGRPVKEEGVSVGEAEKMLSEYGTCREERKHKRSEAGKMTVQGNDLREHDLRGNDLRERRITMVGIGMGGPGQLTGAAVSCLRESQAVFGAPRMLKSVEAFVNHDQLIGEYAPEAVVSWLKCRPDIARAAVVYSGDTGFYSGASGLEAYIGEEIKRGDEAFVTEIIPGIPTVSYMASRLKKEWQNVLLLSSHGRECRIEQELDRLGEKSAVFLLSGGKNGVNELCRRLQQAEREREEAYTVIVGEQLSYPDERIRSGRPGELKELGFAALSAVWVERVKQEE